jgi:signal transduction histidine kinase
VEAASLGVWDADLKQGTWHHSPRHDVILGLITPPVRWSAEILLDRVVPESRAATANSLAAGEASGSLQVECRIRWPDGSLHDIHMVGRFWKDTEGVTTRVAGVVADITQHKVLEARLRHGEKMQAVGLLAGGVAHNFNNILTVVLGSLELAHSKVNASSRVGALLVRAIEAGRKGAEIAHQLLAFARLQPLIPKPADPAELLRGVYLLLQNGLSAIVQVRLEMASDLGSIEIDPVEFELALLNLAMNANDAMPNGGQLRLQASTQCICDTRLGLDGRFLVVEVTDDGVGIAPENLPNVFEPFYTTKEVGKGIGMGLSQVHGFAHQSGGAVDIDSIPGRGTRVRLFLPSTEHRVRSTEVSS